MKIYFAGSIRGGRDDVALYKKIIEHLKSYGEVLTEHVGDRNLSIKGDDGPEVAIHDRDMEWLTACDIVVGEVTQVSLGVGYELGRAVDMDKKILCLYRPQEGKKLSAMIKGCKDITNKEYKTLEEAKGIIDEFVK